MAVTPFDQLYIGENPMLYAHFTAMCVTDPVLLVIEFLHCAEADLS